MNLIVTALFSALFAFGAIPNTSYTDSQINNITNQSGYYPIEYSYYDSGYNVSNFASEFIQYDINYYNNTFLLTDEDMLTYNNLSSYFFTELIFDYDNNSPSYDFIRVSQIRFSYFIRSFKFDTTIHFEHGSLTEKEDITNIYANIELTDPNGQSVTFSNVYLNNFYLEIYTFDNNSNWFGTDIYQFMPSLSSNSEIYSECRSFREYRQDYDPNASVDRVLNRIILGFDFIPEGFLNTYVNEHGDNEYQQGYIDGHESGVQDGYDEGYERGYETGWENGHEEGWLNGIDAERDNIYDEGYQDAIDDWQDFWYDWGYHDGELVGMEEANRDALIANQIFTGIISIALVPVNFFLGILNFDVFGINIGALVSSLLTVLVLITIIKTIFGGKSGGTE